MDQKEYLKQVNDHAFNLATTLGETVRQYAEDNNLSDTTASIVANGAANLLLVSSCISTGSREEAFEALHASMELLHDMIQSAPAEAFAMRQRPDLN